MNVLTHATNARETSLSGTFGGWTCRPSGRCADVLAKLPSSVYLEEREFSEADNEEQTNLHEPSVRTGDRQRFIKAYEQVGFDSAVHKTWAWRRFQLRVLKHKVMGLVGR